MRHPANSPFTYRPAIVLFFIVLGSLSSTTVAQTSTRELQQFPDVLEESSGLAIHNGNLWTINDSGAGPVLHKLDNSGGLLESITLEAASNRDWESLAHDSEYLFVADIGNNTNSRDEFIIYRISWSSLESGSPEVEEIHFRYGDYKSGSRLAHNFDAEGLTVRGDELWLFSKNRGDRNTNLYRFPKLPGSYALMPSQQLPVDSLITAADIHAENNTLLLIGNQNRVRWLWTIPTNDEGVVWEERELLAITPNDQWEAVLWDGDRVLLSHESNARGYAGLAELTD